jgi:hypothetical protein
MEEEEKAEDGIFGVRSFIVIAKPSQTLKRKRFVSIFVSK